MMRLKVIRKVKNPTLAAKNAAKAGFPEVFLYLVSGCQRRIGLRAAAVSSRRERRVV